MTAFYLLHPVGRAVILLLFLILLILNLCILLVALIQTKHYKTVLAALFPVLLCHAALTMLTAALYELAEMHPVAGIFARLPAFAYLAFLLLAGIFTLFLLYRETWRRRNTLTKASIKESADNLPAGLCFSTGTGIVLLSNRRMDTLCHSLTGRDLQDAEDFWQTLTDSGPQEDARRVADAKNPIIRLADGRTWSFTRRVIDADGRPVTQLTAVDTTDLDALRIRLQKDNLALAGMNARLRRYGMDIARVTASEERLATKVRLHDELGHTLITLRHILSKNTVAEESRAVLELWKRNVAVLRGGSAVNEATDWQKLIRFADNVGVIFQIDGSLPADGKSAGLIITAAIEALNNAVRHAGATELRLSLTETDENYIAVFTNNKKLPETEITEGGGLSALRGKIEKESGFIKIAAHPVFQMTLTLPKGKERNGL